MSTVEIYKDAAGEFRWRLKARNGEPVADSGEGYVSRGNVARAVARLRKMLKASVKVTDLTKIPVDGEEFIPRPVNGSPVATEEPVLA